MPATRSIIGKRCATFEEIRPQTQLIAKKFNPGKIILFGSYADGKPTPESDVDLWVITNRNEKNVPGINPPNPPESPFTKGRL